jgi:hypothetical protein
MAVTINASTSAGLVQTADTSGVLQLQTNSGTTAVTIDTSQNVGIGTTSPGALLHTYTSTQESVRFARNSTASSAYVTFYANNSSSAQVQYAGILGDVASSTAGSHGGNLLFYTTGSGTNAERMRIDSSGRLLVGTTSSGGLGGLTTIPNYDGDTAGLIWNKSNATSTGAAEFRYNGTQKGYIAYTSTGTTYNTTSDYRLKENIEPMVNALEKVALLNPVTYTWIESGENGQGFIAHELQNVVPECVFGEKDAVNEDGSIKPQGIDTSFLVATLTAAIQEQQTIINDLKARVTALEAK